MGDAVQHVVVPEAGTVGDHPGGVHHGGDAAGGRVYGHDPVGLPDVGPHRSVDALQLVEAVHRLAGEGDLDPADTVEIVGIPQRQRRRAVGHGEGVGVQAAQPPALSAVGEGAHGVERVEVPDDRPPGLPGELDGPAVAQRGEALPEPGVVQRCGSQDPTGRPVDLADAGRREPAGGLVQGAVDQLQALGEGIGIVRVGGHDPGDQPTDRRRYGIWSVSPAGAQQQSEDERRPRQVASSSKCLLHGRRLLVSSPGRVGGETAAHGHPSPFWRS